MLADQGCEDKEPVSAQFILKIPNQEELAICTLLPECGQKKQKNNKVKHMKLKTISPKNRIFEGLFLL